MAKFGGFTEQQMEALARKMGFTGPMDEFNNFLAASPGKAAALSRYTEKARQIVEGKQATLTPSTQPPQAFAKGGVTTKKVTTTKPSPGDVVTTKAINSPEKLVSQSKTSTIDIEKNQLIDKNSGQVGPASVVTNPETATTATADAVKQPKTVTADPTKVKNAVNAETDKLQAEQGTVGKDSLAEAATAQPSSNATVQGQLNNILTQFEGGELPPWAAGAQRMVNSVMIGRGMGSSTMAESASTQAMMESALEIAVRDAATYSAFEMKNLDNRQQAALQNAQAFLSMDMANLSNRQQTSLFKTQTRVQALFSDQAAENAMKQFNATNQNQANQFFAQLNTQVKQFNAAQKNATSQFNAEQKNTTKMFNAQVRNQRDQFNAENRLIIDQANAKWRQTITTTNNAEANENNRLNAQLLTGMTTAGYNNLWQKERDLMTFAFTAAENASNRALQVVLQKMSGATAKDIADINKGGGWETIAGQVVGKVFDNAIDSWF